MKLSALAPPQDVSVGEVRDDPIAVPLTNAGATGSQPRLLCIWPARRPRSAAVGCSALSTVAAALLTSGAHRRMLLP